MPKIVPQSDIDRFMVLRKNGDSLERISRATGWSVQTVASHLKRLGISGPSRKVRISDETEKEILRLYKARIGSTEIARLLGLHDNTYVYAVLKRNGVAAHHTFGRNARDGDVRILSDGYVSEKVPASWAYLKDMSGQGGNGRWIRQHRKVMAEHLGRPLRRGEQVHHKDGDRSNNDISNLELRIGSHGSGHCLRCRACGSIDLEPY